ncbi:hypothetical protein QJS10_CPB15g00828 [Acorus calamus]|uniref:Ribonuclease H1 N-terminal domain-containing protein n=1 Tax=Acorus calamus TaxID=4465 RepID=A0AAV9D970_ACOCL|nr:hypothetical protein QJS10_CPB15g00828 [Acorus calamus]
MSQDDFQDARDDAIDEGIPSTINNLRRGDKLRSLIVGQLWACRHVDDLGLYSSWKECEAQVKGFSGATYAGMRSLDEVDRYFHEHGVAPLFVVQNANNLDLRPTQGSSVQMLVNGRGNRIAYPILVK